MHLGEVVLFARNGWRRNVPSGDLHRSVYELREALSSGYGINVNER
jgi:hypothetical protein